MLLLADVRLSFVEALLLCGAIIQSIHTRRDIRFACHQLDFMALPCDGPNRPRSLKVKHNSVLSHLDGFKFL